MRSARDNCLRSVKVFGIGVIIPSSFTKFYALPTSPMFARMRTDDATTFTATVCSCTRIQSPMTPISVRPFTLLRLAGGQSFRIIAHEKMRIVASSQNAKYPPPLRWVRDGTSIRHRAAANRHAGGLRTVADITTMARESRLDRPPDCPPSSANCPKTLRKTAEYVKK